MAGTVGSAVVEEVIGVVSSFLVGKHRDKASKRHNIERMEIAHTKLEFVLERSEKLPIIEVSLRRRRRMLKCAYEECGHVLNNCKLQDLGDEENEQGVTHSSFPKRIAHTTRSSIPSLFSRDKGVLGCSNVERFERFVKFGREFLKDLESGCSLRQYMFCNPLIRRLLQGKALEYRMVQGSQKQRLSIHPMNFAERGVEALLLFSNIDLKKPKKDFRVLLMLRLSESTDILGVTVKCLQPLLMPQIKSAVEGATGELARLPTQDIFDSYDPPLHVDYHVRHTHCHRPNPECYKAEVQGTSTLPYKFPEEVIALYLRCSVSPDECNLRSSAEKADKDIVKSWPPLRLGVLMVPHSLPWKEHDCICVTFELIDGTEEERIEHRHASLHQVEEMVLPKAIDCFDNRPEVTKYTMLVYTAHSAASLQVTKMGKEMESETKTNVGSKARRSNVSKRKRR